MSQPHRLVAIMFTDIVGYTALMQQNEEKAIQVRDKHRRIFNSITEKYKGRVLQYYGDGTLSIFDSAIDAVKCGIELQLGFQKDPAIPVRIGIHTGDIIFSEEEIIGDGVNVASRIESLAVPGSVFISEKVYDEIKNQESIKTSMLKTFKLKNVEKPIEVYAISNVGLIVPKPEDIEGKTDTDLASSPEKQEQHKSKIRKRGSLAIIITTIIAAFVIGYLKFGTDINSSSDNLESIAVLPFVNMSGDPEQEYFGDGISEEILNYLAQLPGIKVAGRTSSFSFKNKDLKIQEIGSSLGVSTILEGSVRKMGNRVRITAQLIKVDDGFHLWSQRFDRDLTDIFAIQDEIAKAVVDRLKITLTGKLTLPETRQQTTNTEAYQLYLKGRTLVYKRGTALFEGVEMFKKCIELDSNYALAYAGLSDAYSMISFYGLMPPNEVNSYAIQYANRAMELAPNLAESRNASASVALLFEKDYIRVAQEYRKALQFNPAFTQSRTLYSAIYHQMLKGNNTEAIKQALLSVNLDPLSYYANTLCGMVYGVAGNLEEALQKSEYGYQLDPDSYLANWNLGNIYHWLGNYEKAAKVYEKALEISGQHPWTLMEMLVMYMEMGKEEEARKIYDKLIERATYEYVQPTVLGVCAAALGEDELALEFMNRALETNDPFMLPTAMWPSFKALRSLPGFQEIWERLAHPEVQ